MSAKPLARHDAIDLGTCAQELAAIFENTAITDKDRVTPAYRGWSRFAPATTEFVDHDQYAARVYLGDAARAALTMAVQTDMLPLWAVRDGELRELPNQRSLVAPNSWVPRTALGDGATIGGGAYQPLNVRHDDDPRLGYVGSILWAKNEDWWRVREHLVVDRVREFESEATFARYWKVHHAAAWLASRDSTTVNAIAGRRDALQSLDPKFDGWMATWITLAGEISVRFCECGQRSLSCPALNAAREALRAACEQGAVRAYGQRSASAPREHIPPLEFHEAELWHGRALTLAREVGGKGANIWRELRFESEDVRALGAADVAPPISTTPLRLGVGSSELRSFVRRIHRERGSLPHVTRTLLRLAKDEFGESAVSRTKLIAAVEAEGLARPQSRPRKGPA